MEKMKRTPLKAISKVKEFVRPSSVTWKNPKDTNHDTIMVLAFTLFSGILLACIDAVLGYILRIIL